MRRRLLNLLTALSLLLCVAVVVLWVRSLLVNDALGWVSASDDPDMYRAYFVYSGRGGIALIIWSRSMPRAPDYKFGWTHERAYWYPMQAREGAGRYTIWNRAGFEQRTVFDRLEVTAPYWSIALPPALLPAVRAAARRRRLRFRGACCRRCGYDLRATPGRCPECGRKPQPLGSPSSRQTSHPALP